MDDQTRGDKMLLLLKMSLILENTIVFNKSRIFFLLMGVTLGFFAGIISSIIFFSEFSRHLSDRKKLLKISFWTFFVTFVFFILLSFILGFFIKI